MPVWEVRDGAGRLLLRFSDVPGPILGAAGAIAGSKAPRHPFLTAIFLDLRQEQDIRQLLGAATGPQDFLGRLRGANYTVLRLKE